jgi:peroxiredoxin Q/BCP
MMKTAMIATLTVGASAFAPSSSMISSRSSALDLSVGEAAPDFVLNDQNGKPFTRSKNKKPLVVFFYPGDSTPGCTLEAKSFNEEIGTIRKEYKADVVGISGQGVASKEKFATDLQLDFSILADEGDVVRKAFGVPKAAFGLLPGRVTYVLDKDGVCVSVYNDLVKAENHVNAAIGALEELKPAKAAGGFEFKLPF